jgi:hypothetical protein
MKLDELPHEELLQRIHQAPPQARIEAMTRLLGDGRAAASIVSAAYRAIMEEDQKGGGNARGTTPPGGK